MKGFGEWLDDSKLGLTDIMTIQNETRSLPEWQSRVRSNKVGDYIGVLEQIQGQNKVNALDAFHKLWPLDMDEERNLAYTTRNTRASRVSPTGWAVLLVAAMMIGTIVSVLVRVDPKEYSGETTRGVLAFLFGTTTVSVIIIVVLAVFFEAGDTTLEDRFQRGKDILTILIGLLGAILGYYFGQQSSSSRPPPNPAAAVQVVPSQGAAATGSPGATTK